MNPSAQVNKYTIKKEQKYKGTEVQKYKDTPAYDYMSTQVYKYTCIRAQNCISTHESSFAINLYV